MKCTLAIMAVFLFTGYAHAQTNNSTTVTSTINLTESSIDLGYIGRGGAITGGWSQLPNLLTINYSGRDFAIGGWSKTANNWMGAALFINSDNGNVGIGTTNPTSRLHIDGATTTNVISLAEGSTYLGSLGRGATVTGAWSQYPGILALTYQGRDFAIGGWGKTANNWMGAALFINSDSGNVGIGTTAPDAKLTVLGNIHSREVKVSVDAGADFVFKEEYKLRPLEDVAAFIRSENHLPDIASAEEMKKNGMELGQMNVKLLQKIEELTLYMIDMKKQLENVEKENGKMKEEMIRLKGAR